MVFRNHMEEDAFFPQPPYYFKIKYILNRKEGLDITRMGFRA